MTKAEAFIGWLADAQMNIIRAAFAHTHTHTRVTVISVKFWQQRSMTRPHTCVYVA